MEKGFLGWMRLDQRAGVPESFWPSWEGWPVLTEPISPPPPLPPAFPTSPCRSQSGTGTRFDPSRMLPVTEMEIRLRDPIWVDTQQIQSTGLPKIGACSLTQREPRAGPSTAKLCPAPCISAPGLDLLGHIPAPDAAGPLTVSPERRKKT